MPLPIRPGPPPVIPSRVPSPTMPPVVVARPDPLAVTLANGTTFTPVDRAQLAAEASKALMLGADVPARVQDGPTCGLYALGMVMDFWDKIDPAHVLSPLVQDSDVVRWDSHHQEPDTKLRLLDVAKQKGFTTQGEMFYARQLATLARSFGYNATVTDTLSLDEIHAAVDRGHPALIGFDVDNNGNPGLFEGKRAHWAVVEGHFAKDGVEYLVATHGWTGKEYVWRADDFMASVNQLNKSDFVGAPSDITQTLKGLMVEVYPRP